MFVAKRPCYGCTQYDMIGTLNVDG